MNRAVSVFLFGLLVFLLGGCRGIKTYSAGAHSVDEDIDGFFARMELSCSDCGVDDEIDLTVYFGFESSKDVRPFRMEIDAPDFIISEHASRSFTAVDASYVVTKRLHAIRYPQSVRLRLFRKEDAFSTGKVRIRLFELGENGNDLSILDAYYAQDELGTLFAGSRKSVMKTSLNRVYQDGWIDEAEFLRRECLSLYGDQRMIHSPYDNGSEVYLVYASANLRAMKILSRTDPLAVSYRELEATYQAGLLDHSSLNADWKHAELHALAEAFLNLLKEEGSITEEAWRAETLHLADQRVMLTKPEKPEHSAFCFKARFDSLYYNGGDDTGGPE